MLDKDLLNRKLSLLSGYINDLSDVIARIPADYTSISKDDLQLTERRFQLTVDTMSDINIHLIKEGNLGDPDDVRSTFRILGQNGVLDRSFAEKVAPIVGARNMIVHQYEKLDTKIFLTNLKNNFNDFGKYISQISDFLGKKK